ncbi:MAG: hypothetical protein Q8O38_16260 [Sulfurimicrobium sp.]|nr:hypothetical protein [Sulfurimicrobium sp.]
MNLDALKSKLELSFAGCPDADTRCEIAEEVLFAFPDMPPPDDTLLFICDMSSDFELRWIRDDFSGRGRYDLIDIQKNFIDHMYRASIYARWYFAPSLMMKVLMSKRETCGEYAKIHPVVPELDSMDLPFIVFSGSMDISDGCGHVIEGYDPELLNVPKMIQSFSLRDLHPTTQKKRLLCGGLEDFSRSAAYYSPLEKKVVSRLLGWLESYYPGESCVYLAKKHFWDI